jgi:ABC-type Na+ efflux pump, permease component
MNKIKIVVGREYFTRVKKRSFIVLTILMPVLFIGLILGAFFLSTIESGEIKKVMVLDGTGEYRNILKDNEQYEFLAQKGSLEDFRQQSDEEVYATLVITENLLENPKALTLYSRSQVQASLLQHISSQLDVYLSEKKLESYQISGLKQMIEDSKIQVRIENIRMSDSGKETQSSAEFASTLGMIFTFLIYMFIFSYGVMVMQGVIEEKTNRIIEVMVSSVKPFDLMMGKLIGIGLVGLTQFGIWAVLFLTFTLSGSFLMNGSEIFQQFSVMLGGADMISLFFYFILFFIGGYLIYASLFAAIGAMVNAQEDTQQYMMPLTVLIFFAFYAGFYSSQNPDGPLAFWTSLIPLTSPIVMMTRLPFGVPWWELLLSITLLALTVILIVALAAKIYRVGILMYGKKPTYAEILKWFKY